MIAEGSDVLDPDNPYSLQQILPDEMAKALETIPLEFYSYNERELRNRVKPPLEVGRLRINFWFEYNQATEESRKMTVRNMTTGACSLNYFYNVILKNPSWLGFITTPPAEYQLAVQEMHERGFNRLSEVLDLPLMEKVPVTIKEKNPETGKTETRTEIIEKVNTNLIDKITKITNMFDLRIKGAIVQRLKIDQRNVNVNVDGSGGLPFRPEQTMAQLEAMEKKIERLRSHISEVETIDADTEEPDSASTEEIIAELNSATGPSLAEEPTDSAAKQDQPAKSGDH